MDGPAPEKKQKRKKDPNAPKKALQPYVLFCKDNRKLVELENPGIGFGEIGKILGKRWGELPADEKVKYVEEADKDKVRYEEEMQAYKLLIGKDPKAPKKPMQPYVLFCKEHREQIVANNPGITFGDIGKLLGKAWADCGEADKARYNELAEKDKGRYEEEMAEYRGTTAAA